MIRRAVLLALIYSGVAQGSDHQFHLSAPQAQSVVVMGEFNSWHGEAMSKGSDGTWSVTISLNPGSYGYKFLVDGKDWMLDPNNSARKTVDGIENSAVEISNSSSPAFSFLPEAKLPMNNGSAALPLKPGETITVEAPLSPARRAQAVREGNARLLHAKVAIAAPQNFDFQKSWPILVISNTEAYSNIDAMQQFKDAALREGWVIMAADAAEADKGKEGGWRYPCAGAAFDYMTAALPGMKQWQVACAGHSGGAKNSGFLAGELGREGHRIIGILMIGCNWDTASAAYRRSAPPGFLGVAVFLSSGKTDTIATPAHHEQVRNSLRATGFQKVRLEIFDGGHEVYQPHIGEALRWFAAQAPGNVAVQQESDFEKMFKKKP